MLGFERQIRGEHFIEYDTERPDVGALIGCISLRLLGRHVRECSKRSAGLGQSRTALELCDTKIHDLEFSAARKHDVLGFDIAVDNVLVVGGFESLRDLGGPFERLDKRNSGFQTGNMFF